jgi:ABC-type multidrug transport system ATPase subunit/pSer/pThr/pTyr-binding forkhead associated (FHA) protein
MEPEPGLLLQIRWPGGDVEERPVAEDVLHIGREPANDIVLNFPSVSNHHLRLTAASGTFEITDLGSTNGTMLNGAMIPHGVPHEIRPGDVVRIGDFYGNSISFALAVSDMTEIRRDEPVTMELAGEDTVLIGRDPASSVHLDHPLVSWHHARLVLRGGRHELEDLGSTNGTFVNALRVAQPVPLDTGDEVKIGPFILRYDPRLGSVASEVRRGHRLDAIDLGVAVGDGHMILREVSLSVEDGEFVGLVGGSGAGKSTLLKAASGYSPATHGRMLIDGRDLYSAIDGYRTQMGFVPQDDIIHTELPVRRALWHAARLRLPDADEHEITRRIDDVLAMLDMTDRGDQRVRLLSGGQRKRVSIGVELLAQPTMLFLDEPTSGLDPGLEKRMMFDLNRLADQGRTVLLVTHATANIEQCHQVAFLAQGRLAYFGPPREAITFFGARDFADIYLKLSSDAHPEIDDAARVAQPPLPERPSQGNSADASPGELWAERYLQSPQFERYVVDRQARLAIETAESAARPAAAAPRARDSAWRQLGVLARRHLDLIRHSASTLVILLVLMPLLAALFAAVSERYDLVGLPLEREQIREELRYDLRGAPVDASEGYIPATTATLLITMVVLALTQLGTFGAAYEIVKERAIFKRERTINLKVSSYVLSKALVLGGFGVIQVVCALIVLGLRVRLPSTPVLQLMPSASVELFVTLLLAVLASIGLGLFISAVVPNADVVLYVILAQLFLQIVLAGTLFPLPKGPLSMVVISSWTVDATGSTVGVRELNLQSEVCRVVETVGGGGSQVMCSAAPLSDEDLVFSYERSPSHLLRLWLGLTLQTVVWIGLTMWVQARKKPE